MIFTAQRFDNHAEILCEADNVVMRKEMDKPLRDTLRLDVLCKFNIVSIYRNGNLFVINLSSEIEFFSQFFRIFFTEQNLISIFKTH